ncbi:MAG: hypothetical protein V3T55_10165 [Anaerolineales bacterium]
MNTADSIGAASLLITSEGGYLISNNIEATSAVRPGQTGHEIAGLLSKVAESRGAQAHRQPDRYR